MIPPVMFVLRQSVRRHVPPIMNARARVLATGTLVLALMACGDAPQGGAGGESPSVAPAVAGPAVQIVQPADGAAVQSTVTIVLEVSGGLTIMPAGTMDPGTGHHHLVVDAPVPPAGAPIPTTPGVHIHMGQAQTEYEITGLAAGAHTVIAVVGDGGHMPLTPLVTDTVRFVVQ
jgi:hypothetical protein